VHLPSACSSRVQFGRGAVWRAAVGASRDFPPQTRYGHRVDTNQRDAMARAGASTDASSMTRSSMEAEWSSMEASGDALSRLPLDLQLHILSMCEAAGLLDVSCCSRLLCRLAQTPVVWESAILRRHAAVIGALFGGEVPRPANGRSWKQHAYEFDAGQWRELIRVQTGRLLLCMSSNCTTSCPSYFGVPPPCPSDSPLFTIRVPYFGLRFPAHLEHLTGARPTSYGVFDVTDFAEHHPGGRELLADAVLDSDCTERFDRAAHTERARQVLRRLAVPGLAEVPIPPPLVRPPPSLLVRLTAWALTVLKHARALPHRMWAITVARAVARLAGGLSPDEPRQTRGVAGGKSSVIEQM
jgi:hypothetical protein